MILPKMIRSEAEIDARLPDIRSGTERAILSRILYETAGRSDVENDAPALEQDRVSDTYSPNAPGQKKMKMRTAMMVGVGFAALALNSCGQKPAPAETIPAAETAAQAGQAGAPQAMRVTRIAQRDLSDEITGTGRLVVREEAAVGTELSGYRVEKVYVDEGDWVKAGQPLAKMDDTLLKAQIAQAVATLAQQKASADFNTANLEAHGKPGGGGRSLAAIA